MYDIFAIPRGVRSIRRKERATPSRAAHDHDDDLVSLSPSSLAIDARRLASDALLRLMPSRRARTRCSRHAHDGVSVPLCARVATLCALASVASARRDAGRTNDMVLRLRGAFGSNREKGVATR